MTMPKQMRLYLAAATLSAVSAVCAAQAADQPGPANSNSLQTQTEAAPIERAYPDQNHYANGPAANGAGSNTAAPGVNTTTEPIAGVMLRVTPQSEVQQVSSDAEKFELRVERGVANINVHDPGKDKVILVDLPGGQTQLLKNGLYTFNAETSTARVLKGEALAFPEGAAANAKPLKVKEDNKVVFNGTDVKPHEFVPYEASMDLLPGPEGPRGDGGAGYAYGYGPYGDGFYGGYPYYGYGYPGWGYPYSYGYGFYPFGVGLGFGYYGGFHGGYGGGFHGGGGGFHGGGGGHGRR
jgi:hypothetical protein